MAPAPSGAAPARIAVLTWSQALGDTLLLVPAIRVLRAAYPAAHLRLIGPSETAGILMDSGIIDAATDNSDPRLAPMATGIGDRSNPGVASALIELDSALGRADLVVAIVSGLEAARSGLGTIVTRSLVVAPTPPVGVHVAEHLVRSLDVLGVRWPWPGIAGIETLRFPGYVGRRKSILIHPGSGAPWKCAPSKLYRDIGIKLSKHGHDVKVVMGPADRQMVEAMNWPGEIVRPDSLGSLRRHLVGAEVFVGNDSGVTHLAGLLGTPTVGLFGPTHPASWAPLGPLVRVIRSCTAGPSARIRVCDDAECLAAITPQEVINAVNVHASQPA